MKLDTGQKAPDFRLPSHLDGEISLSSFRGKSNVVLAFFPLAWTPVWTNQIPSYEAETARFEGLNAQVLGVSIDHIPCLKAWAQSLGGINFPLLSDFSPFGAVADLYGVRRNEGFSERAIFVIDKEGLIRYIDIHDIGDRPNNEVLFKELERITRWFRNYERVRELDSLNDGVDGWRATLSGSKVVINWITKIDSGVALFEDYRREWKPALMQEDCWSCSSS